MPKKRGLRVIHTIKDGIIIVVVSKNGRGVSPVSAESAAKKLFPEVVWDFTRQLDHRTAVYSKPITPKA